MSNYFSEKNREKMSHNDAILDKMVNYFVDKISEAFSPRKRINIDLRVQSRKHSPHYKKRDRFNLK